MALTGMSADEYINEMILISITLTKIPDKQIFSECLKEMHLMDEMETIRITSHIPERSWICG